MGSKKDHFPYVALILGAIFSAWASYRMHVLADEVMVQDIVRELIQMQGRAPDQYRALPYFLIGQLDRLLSFIPYIDNSLRYAILAFDAGFIFFSVRLLLLRFASLFSMRCAWLFFLIFPILMFGGYRPVSSFVLFLAVLWVTRVCMREDQQWGYRAIGGMIALLLVICTTRADVALLLVLCLLPLKGLHSTLKCLVIMLPLVAQAALKYMVFPDAQYYTTVVMISDNMGMSFLMTSPLTYLLLAWALCYRETISVFIGHMWRFERVILLVMLSYVLALFVIARPDEYRLFLPLLPIVLWVKTRHTSAFGSLSVR